MLGERGEAKGGDMALLALSDREPGGDELIWIGATAPSTGESGGSRRLHGGEVVGTNMYVGAGAALESLITGGGGDNWTT